MFGRSREKKTQQAKGDDAGWFVEAAGRVWGPYPEDRIEHFIAEGRVAPETPLALDRGGPFTPAERCGRFRRLFPKEARASELLRPPRRPAETERPAGDGRSAPEAEPARPILVWAHMARPQGFEAALGVYGPTVRIERDLWLLRGRVSPAALRNALSRRLEADDMLMVIEAPLAQAAWFNIDDSTDRVLRQLWLGTGEG